MLLGLAGVALVVGVESVHSLEEFLGALAMIGAAFFYGALELRRQGPLRLAGRGPDVVDLASRSRACMTLPVGIATTPGPHARRSARSPRSSSLGVLGTALAFVIYYELIAGIGAGARRARLLPGAGRRAVLRRDLPRRGDHGRRDRRPGADPGRRGDRLAAEAVAGPAPAAARADARVDGVLVSARVDLTLSPAEEEFRDTLRAWIAENHPGTRARGRRGVVRVPSRLAAQAQRPRLGRPDLADRVRRRRRDADRAGDLLRGDRARPRAADGQRARADDGRADA